MKQRIGQLKQQQQQDSQDDSSSQSSQSSEDQISSEQQQQIIEKQMHHIKEELKNMPYELIIKQKLLVQYPEKESKNKLVQGAKQLYKTKKIYKQQKAEQRKKDRKAAKQINIHKRTFKKVKPIFEPTKKKGIDPRFQTYAGNYNQDLAMKSYGFIPKLQQAEIAQIKGRLKNPSKRNKINTHQREILTQEYNRLTSDYKRVELMQLQRQTKKQLKQQYGEDFHMKKNQFRQQFEKRKFKELDQKQKQKKLRDKQSKLQRNFLSERRKTLHMQSRDRR